MSDKIPLPHFLKLLTSNAIPMQKAMAIAGKVYKQHNTPDALAQMNDAKLKDLDVGQEDRKLVMAALQKAGYTSKPGPSRRKVVLSPDVDSSHSPNKQKTTASSSSHPKPITSPSKPPKRKRKQTDDRNEFLSMGPPDERDEDGPWEFNEVLDEELIQTKSCVINRAPVMMAWATLIAERMHFSRTEALSIASAYTEMNAVSKGISLGIYRRDEERGIEAAKNGSQPYVELIGRRIPLYRAKNDKWQALSNGKPVLPSSAFQYINRSFRQTTPFVMGALKILADSYSLQELNEKAWSLYADFRPEVNEWGKRSEIHCSTILNLRKKVIGPTERLKEEEDQKPAIGYDTVCRSDMPDVEPQQKKPRILSVEEYERVLDEDGTFDDIDLDFSVQSPSTSVTTQL